MMDPNIHTSSVSLYLSEPSSSTARTFQHQRSHSESNLEKLSEEILTIHEPELVSNSINDASTINISDTTGSITKLKKFSIQESKSYPIPSFRVNDNVLIKPVLENIYDKHQSKRSENTDILSVTSFGNSSNYDNLLDSGNFMPYTMATVGSIMYSSLIVILGVVISMSDLKNKNEQKTSIYSSILTMIGIAWLAFLHYDIHKYKNCIMRMLFPDGLTASALAYNFEMSDKISTTTEIICNSRVKMSHKRSASAATIECIPAYRFLRGRHSGSFYLKCGLAAFCFGNLIHDGLRFGQQIYYATSDQSCVELTSLVIHLLRPMFSFYQLFLTFKYSNIVINRHKYIAQLGLMHLIGTSISFWLGAIIDDAVVYLQKISVANSTDTLIDKTSLNDSSINKGQSEGLWPEHCSRTSLLSSKSIEALPYLYPFTIEFNLLLAALWFIIWRNIGKDSDDAHPHPFEHKICQDIDGKEDVHYESNLVIKVDCHSSNKGLFAGLFILMISFVTMILFFVAINTKMYIRTGLYIHTIQETLLPGLILIVSLLAYRQTSRLDINPYKVHSHLLDYSLLLIPVPFYFLNNILSIQAEILASKWFEAFSFVLATLQVLVQTSFIIDAMNRCAQSRKMRFNKPGRELITFAILLNITWWIISTFETKAAEEYHSEISFYGHLPWLIISHTTHPLMLFYRFHSSVCLADVWKFGYEKAQPH